VRRPRDRGSPRIHRAQRIQRALEVFEIARRPLPELRAREAGGALGPAIAVALVPAIARALHAVIAERFDAMLAAASSRLWLRKRYASRPTCHRCGAWVIGRRGISRRAHRCETLRDKGIAATRQLAKRQHTRLRVTAATAFDPASPRLADAIHDFIKGAGLPALTVRCCCAIIRL
jgi:tRNA dimethylallyltransferase